MNRKKLRFVVSSMSVLLAVNSPAVTLAAQSQDTFEELRAGEETEENWQEEEIPEFFCGTADEEEELLTGTADIQEEEEITAIQGTKGMPEKISASGEEALNKVQSYLRTAVTSPTVSSIGGEWAVLAMARQGMLPEGTRAAYLANLFMTLDSNANGNVLHNIKSTENSRVILALSSIGVNPSSFQGYNLLEPLADMSYVGKQGINGTIFALIALDTKKYEVPKLSAEDIAAGRLQTTRDGLIAEILSREIPGGGWTLSGSQADPDMTGMALQALAPYKERADVKPYVERGIKKLAELRAEDGSYSNGGDKNVESVVQVLVALAALDSSLIENEAFIKNGKTLVDEILLFQVENGSFSHIRGDGGDGMATEQAAYALTAWYRANHGMTSLYNMTDIAADISDENPDDSTDKAPDTVTKEEIEAFRKKIQALPERVTLQDKEMVYRLKIELEQMKAFDEKKHFTALLDAKKSQILKLEKGIIPKEIFEGVNTSKQDYLYENGEYTIRLKGKNTYTPADMKAEIEKKQEKDSLSFTVKAEGALPGEVELSIKCTMKDGIYMLYELQDGVWREAQWTGISNGFMKCDVSKGGSYLLKKAELGDSEQEKSDEEEKQQEKENTVSGTKSTTKTSSGSTGRSGASSAFSQSKPSSNTIKAEVKNGIVEKKTFEDIKGKDKNLKIEGEAAKDKPYRIIINGKDVKKAEDMKAGIKEGSPYEKEIKMLADSPYIFHFEEAGAFPGQVKVEMSVDKADGAYLLLHYDEKEQKAEYIQKVEIKDKKTQFLVSEGGTYFIDKKAKTKSIKELLAEEKEQQKSLKEKEKKNAVLSDEAEEEEFLAGTADTEKSSPLKTAAAALFVTAAGAVGGFLYYRKKRK